ncbi:DUF4864 domain-containing protein [Abditibacterium utsteinense]|nr:DUF4864 domain-containing protein [Abditibacterium utsteinense]
MKTTQKTTRFFLFAPVLLSLLSAPARCAPAAKPKNSPAAPTLWKAATSAQRAQAAASIRAQLDAFKRNDWDKAATFQSEGLRRNFGTTAQFRAVITANYPQFAKYKSVAFNASRALGGHVEMQVLLTGQDGVKLRAIYLMIKERGAYRVAGVQGGNSGGARPGMRHNPTDYV